MVRRTALLAISALMGISVASGIARASDVPATPQSTQAPASTPEPKKPHGCLFDGAVGAVGGHFVRSGHAKLGAVGGCAYGWHEKHKWKKEHKAWEQEQKELAQHPAPQPQAAPQ